MKYERVNIGEIIKNLVIEKGINFSQFAAIIGLHRQNVEKTIFSKASIDTNLMILISETLEEDLFRYYKPGNIVDDKCNNSDYIKQEVKATLTIELKKEKRDEVLRLVFGDTNLEILNK